MKVLLDTNFLIDLARFKIDMNQVCTLVDVDGLATLTSVKKELERLSKRTSRAGMHAKVALRIIQEYNIKIIKSDVRPDDALLKFAGEGEIVATSDRELRRKLKALGRKTIYLKSKKHLAIG